jgi:hypothetical protein
VVSIFTRELTDDLASLVKQIDDTVAKNKDQKMAAFVVLLTDDPAGAEKQLVALAEKHGIKNTPLTFFQDTNGPPDYKVSAAADVTVMLWVQQTVRANHAFGKGGLNKAAVKKIVADTAKILN